jgi:hypothetical protein
LNSVSKFHKLCTLLHLVMISRDISAADLINSSGIVLLPAASAIVVGAS